MEFEKLDNSNLWDKTYQILKESIVWRHLEPNEKISIPELSRKLGVSRTPIRDALNRLEKDGLVVTQSKVGTFVKAIDARTALDIIDSRMMLEYWSIRRALRGPAALVAEAIGKLEAIARASARDLEAIGLEDYLKRDYNFMFHLELVRMGNNGTNTELYTNLMNYRHILYSTQVVSADMIRQANAEHEDIVASLRKGGETDILLRIEAHLEASKALLLEKIRSSGDRI